LGANNKKTYPSCFGQLETVFPKGSQGLRETPDTCLRCSDKTECLKTAMSSVQGLKARQEIVDRAYQTGRMTFFERWSLRKTINQRIREMSRSGKEA